MKDRDVQIMANQIFGAVDAALAIVYAIRAYQFSTGTFELSRTEITMALCALCAFLAIAAARNFLGVRDLRANAYEDEEEG